MLAAQMKFALRKAMSNTTVRYFLDCMNERSKFQLMMTSSSPEPEKQPDAHKAKDPAGAAPNDLDLSRARMPELARELVRAPAHVIRIEAISDIPSTGDPEKMEVEKRYEPAMILQALQDARAVQILVVAEFQGFDRLEDPRPARIVLATKAAGVNQPFIWADDWINQVLDERVAPEVMRHLLILEQKSRF